MKIFKVGQKWKTRAGVIVLITTTSRISDQYPIGGKRFGDDDGTYTYSWSLTGRFLDGAQVHVADLVELIEDVGTPAPNGVITPVPPAEDPRRAPDFLEAGAATYRERNAKYGDAHIAFGAVMDGLFPNGLTIPAGDRESFARLGVFVQCASKLLRYAHNLTSGGHADSARDLSVYGAMLEELTKEK